MTISYHAYGTSAVGSTSVAPAYPVVSAGDMLLLFVATKPASATISTPSGWTALASASGTTGSDGADTGPTKMAVFWKIATGSESGTQSVSISSGNSSQAYIVSYTKTLGYWSTPAFLTYIRTSGGSAYSATFTAPNTSWLQPGDYIEFNASIPTDAPSLSSGSPASSGITWGGSVGGAIYPTTTGNDSSIIDVSGDVASGAMSGTTITVTTSMSGTLTNVYGPSILVRLRDSAGGTTYQATGTLNTVTTVVGSSVFKGASSASAPVVTTTSGTITFTGRPAGSVSVVTGAVGTPTSYQEITALSTIATTINGNVVSYGEITGNISVESVALGSPYSYQEINATNPISTTVEGVVTSKFSASGSTSVTTLTTGSIQLLGEVSGSSSIVTTLMGDVSVISGSSTYQVIGTSVANSTVVGVVTSDVFVSATTDIVTHTTGAVSIISVPVYQVAGTITVSTETTAALTQHNSVSGISSSVTSTLGTVSSTGTIFGVSAIASALMGSVSTLLDVAGLVDVASTVSGVVRISGSPDLPSTITLTGHILKVKLDVVDDGIIIVGDQDEHIVLKARYNEITLEAH